MRLDMRLKVLDTRLEKLRYAYLFFVQRNSTSINLGNIQQCIGNMPATAEA